MKRTLRQRLVRAAAWLAAAVTSATAWAAQPLLTPSELQALLPRPELRVLDIRSPTAYAQAHVPGALSAPYGAWRGPAANPGQVPELAQLTALVQKLGLSPVTHAVVVSTGEDATDFGAAARVVWTLKLLGLKDLSVLNGGAAAWAAAQLPQEQAAASLARSDYVPIIDASLIASREDLLARAGLAGGPRLVDARPVAFYTGNTRHAAALVPGTLKGAVNLEHTRWFAPDSSRMLDADAVRRIAAEAQLASGGETVSFCNTGHWAATNWFALSEVAGVSGVKLYPGSMVDWSQGPGAQAMENVPERGGQLWIDFKLWIDRTFK